MGLYQYANTWLALVLRTLICRHESLSILEVSEQAITGTERNKIHNWLEKLNSAIKIGS